MTRKRLYVITGFLGAGKTTLMGELLALFAPNKCAALVNEFGEKGVDGAILAGRGVSVTEIAGGSVFCVCRSGQFVEALAEVLRADAEILLVETSGLSDPGGMGAVLEALGKAAPGQLPRYDYMGAIAVVDAARFHKVMGSAVAVKQQVRGAGLNLNNKTDLATPAQVSALGETLRALNPAAPIHETRHARFNPDWLAELAAAQQTGGIHRHTLGVAKGLYKIPRGVSAPALLAWLHSFAGGAYRVKGFVELDEGWRLVDAVGDAIRLAPASAQPTAELVVLAGTSDVQRQARAGLALLRGDGPCAIV
jgi:G3E family GTPase